MKFENINFSKEDLEVINSYEPLAEWFKKYEFQITYFEFLNPHFESYFGSANEDIKALEKMVNVAMCWIKDKTYSTKEKAIYASVAINKIFNSLKNSLSPEFAKNGFVNSNINDIGNDIDVLNPPMLIELEYNSLQKKKNKLMEEIKNIDNRMNEISSAQKSGGNKNSTY